MKEKYDNNIIRSYEKLIRHLRHAKRRNIIYLENIEFSQDLNLRKLLVDAGLYKNGKGNSTLTLTHHLILANVKCKTFNVTGICIENSTNIFRIKNSTIESLWIHSCKFSSLEIKKSIISELTIIDCHIQENVNFDFSRLSDTYPVKINIEDTMFDGDVVVSHLKIANKTSQFLMNGVKINGNFVLCQSLLLSGNIDFTCEFERDCILRMINSIHDDNQYQLLPNMGDISINGGEIVEDLVLEDCHLNSLSIANTPVGGTREFDFSYNILKGNAAIVLRDGASKKNDVLLVEKYTAESFDTHLRDKAKVTYKKWISLLDHKQIRIGKKHRLFQSIIIEPIELLIPSLTSGEGILLWLNKYSNDFNRSWTRGVGFTLIITLLSYFFLNYIGMEHPYFVLDLHFNGFGEVFKGYLSLLDVFNLTGISNTVKFDLTVWGYLFLFFAKVLITYGFWQTIYAFFRYRK